MSDFSKLLQAHAGATSLLASIIKSVVGTLTIQPNEKAGLLQAVQEVEDTANGLHHSFSQQAADVGGSFLSGETVAEQPSTVPQKDVLQPITELGLATHQTDAPQAVTPLTSRPSDAAPIFNAHQQSVADELNAAREAYERAQSNARSVGVPI